MNIHWYDVVTAVCLLLFIVYLIAIIEKVFFSPREENIKFFREYKKGRFALAYITVYPLALIANLFRGETVLKSIFMSFKQVVDLIVLKYEYTNFNALLDHSLFFNVTLHFAFVMIAINTLMFTLSLFGQYLSQSFHMLRMNLGRKNKLYIIGDRPENKHIYFSEKSPYKLIIGKFSDAMKDEYYLQRIFYHTPNLHENYIKKIINGAKRGLVTVVINTDSSEENIELCMQFQKAMQSLRGDTELMKRIRVFVFGNPDHEEIYLDIVSNSTGCLHYINKYQQIAMDFIDKYPLTAFMNEDHIDYSTALVKDGVDLNFILLGFGNTNRQIFLSSVANNQFLTGDSENPQLKLVDYYVFDKEDKEASKNLNHNYNRYKNEIDENSIEDYLPLPQQPANKYFSKLDVNSPQFYKEIRKIVTEAKNSVNVITIALGSDLQNLDLAKKLCMKTKEWGAYNCNIFVKSGSRELGSQLFAGEKCYFIGDEKAVFNISDITCDKFTKMSLLRDAVYNLEYELKKRSSSEVTKELLEATRIETERRWYLERVQIQRESNMYACLSLRSKLNMVGLDYVAQESEKKGLSEKEYLDIYTEKDPIFYQTNNLEIDGKRVIKYNHVYPASLRKNLALLEHHRWNAFMITKGFVPATKEQILNEKIMMNGVEKFSNGKNFALRRHGNITTFEGLEEFAKMIATRDNRSMEQTDVISYDYQILDDAYWLVNKIGMKIISVRKEQNSK